MKQQPFLFRYIIYRNCTTSSLTIWSLEQCYQPWTIILIQAVLKKKTVIKKKSGLALTIKHHFRVAYRKPSKKIIARKFYEPKQYMYLRDMMGKRLGKQLSMECVTLAKRRGKLWLHVRGLPSPILLEEV